MLLDHLKEIIPKKASLSQTLSDAGYYSLLSGGKRIRPLIPLLIIAGHGVAIPPYLDAICSLELIHTYSLIHDDLPSMDDDDFRRGKPSLHKAFSESTAILTGDFFLTYAFELIGRSLITPEMKVDLIVSLSSYSGALGLIGGQIEDLAESPKTVAVLEQMYTKKTSALFSCALDFGAIMTSDIRHKKLLHEIGIHMGIIYQYLDDLSDLDGCMNTSLQSEAKERLLFHEEQLKEKTALLTPGYHLLISYLFNELFATTL